MKCVVYDSPFVPAEWIAAHGLQPRRVVPSATASGPSAGTGVCPYAHAVVQTLAREGAADAVVMATTCDQMRRGSELVERACRTPLFLMNVPKTWQTPAAHRLYREETARLGRFLVQLGGKTPSRDKLASVMVEYNSGRSALRAARGRLSTRDYCAALVRFHREGISDLRGFQDASERKGVPVAVVGGPLLAEHLALFDLVERAGGRVVLDGTTTGERTLPAPFDRRRLRDDPFGELADAYFGAIPDAFRRPNTALYQWLRREIHDRGVLGIVFRRYVWCDTWLAEVQRMKEWVEVPLLELDAEDSGQISPRTVSRIQVFIDVLK